MQWTCAFARVLSVAGELDRAEKYCRKAAKLYESQSLNKIIRPTNVDYELSNQRCLIKLLQVSNCGIEVESLLLRRLFRMIENFWECNAKVIRGVAKSLMQINETLSKDDRARHKVALKLENFTRNLYPQRFVPLASLPLLHSLIGIASAYSEGRAFKEADLIFELLSLFDSGKMWQTLGSCASSFHFQYGLHFGRLGQAANLKSEWLLSMRKIAPGNIITHDVDEEVFVEPLRDLFERMKTKADMDDKDIEWTELSQALERYDAALLRYGTKNAVQNIEAYIKGEPAMLHPKLSKCHPQPASSTRS